MIGIKKYLIVFVVLFSSFANGQGSRYIDIKYVPKDGTDTISTKAKVYNVLFNKTYLNPLSFDRSFLIGDEDNNKRIKERNIKHLSFTDFIDKKRIFVSVPEIDDDELYERMIVGDVSWYREFYPHGYDGGIQITDHFVKKGHKPTKSGMFTSFRRVLGDLTKDKPELLPEIDVLKNIQTPEGAEKVKDLLIKYNTKQ